MILLVGVSDEQVTRPKIERDPEAWEAQRTADIVSDCRQTPKRSLHIVAVIVSTEDDVMIQR